jgi:orotidine-5'-phosphate decarboxylase
VTAARDLPARIEDRLIVALDVPTIAEARALAASLKGVASFFKLGWWLLLAAGFDGLLAALTDAGNRVFLDAKIFDIGETVRHGAARAAERGVSFLTVHGDAEIIRAAVEGKGDSPLKILAITVLTSTGAEGLRDLGSALGVEELIRRRARLAADCGADGIIAAPSDAPTEIRRQAGCERLLVVTPGIRLAGAPRDDQKRVGTPAEAIAAGADYLVVGRPITRSPDPVGAARAIIEDMRRGL